MARRNNFQNASEENAHEFNGDGERDDRSSNRMNQERDWYERNERRRGARSQHRSTQDFENGNGYTYNRGREGDQDWRQSDYSSRDYRQDYGPNANYGERYGFSGYGRSQYDPDINRSWREDPDTETWRAGQPFTDREQDYRGGRWNRDTHDYEPRHGRYYGSWNPRMRESANERSGGYSGVGPKNYRRSDERIQEEVCDLLTYHSGIDASNVEVSVRDGEVTLTGEIPDRYMKRMAEDTIDEIPGVKNITNNLRVEQSNRSYMMGDDRKIN